MRLTPIDWNKIRESFSEEEKEKLNSSISGEILCPRTVIIDTAKLGPELLDKLCKELVKANKK